MKDGDRLPGWQSFSDRGSCLGFLHLAALAPSPLRQLLGEQGSCSAALSQQSSPPPLATHFWGPTNQKGHGCVTLLHENCCSGERSDGFGL